jgi:hypothetical protein
MQGWARAFLVFAFALSRSRVKLFALALWRSFLGLNFALSRSCFGAPALLDFSATTRDFYALKIYGATLPQNKQILCR